VGFDYEAKRSYSITVRVHDGANTFDRSLTVLVTNINEVPTAVTLSNASVAENLAAGTAVGTLSTTDPDTSLVSKGGGSSQPAYHHHRAIDDDCGVITALETTSGSIAENKKLMSLVQAHEQNVGSLPAVLVADHKYGTAENYVACHQAGLLPHLGDAKAKAGKVEGIFPESQFHYQAQDDTFVCPAQKLLRRRRFVERQRVWEYGTDKGVCPACPLRSQCTRSQTGRTLSRHEHAEILEQCRAQANSPAAKANRRRRQHLMERSFGDAANNHGFKRSRWRRLWRQQIQDYLIAAIQNIRILLAELPRRATPGAAIALEGLACVN
jgi:hypothetical protein